METGKKVIKVKIRDRKPSFGQYGEVVNRLSSALIETGGDYIAERIIGTGTEITRKRIKTASKDSILKINQSLDTYAESEGKTPMEVFLSGEIKTGEENITLRHFPFNDIAILRKTEIGIENITDLCMLDSINGLVKIPLDKSVGLFSVIYNHSRFYTVKETALRLPVIDNYGITQTTI